MRERKKLLTVLMLLGALTLSACGTKESAESANTNSEVAEAEADEKADAEEEKDDADAEEADADKEDADDHGGDLGKPAVNILSIDDAFAETNGEPVHLNEYYDAKVGTWTYQIDASGSDTPVDDYEFAKLGDVKFLENDGFGVDDIVDPTDIIDINGLNEDEYDSFFADFHRDANDNPDFMTIKESNNKLRCVLVSVTNWNEITVMVHEHLGTIYQDGAPYEYLTRAYTMKGQWVKDTDPQEFVDAVKNTLGVELQLDWVYED